MYHMYVEEDLEQTENAANYSNDLRKNLNLPTDSQNISARRLETVF